MSLEWGLRFCIYSMFLNDVDVTSPRTTIGESLHRHNFNKVSYLVVQDRLAEAIRKGVVRHRHINNNKKQHLIS